MTIRNLSYLFFSSILLVGCGDSSTTGTSGGESGATDVVEVSAGDISRGGGNTGAECNDSLECNDDDPCTLEACEDGFCAFYDSNAPGCDTNLGGAECKTDSDCEALAPTGSACVIARCNPDSNICDAQNAADGTSCDDGDACTSEDSCQDGVCNAGTEDPCDDGDACTEDSCDSETGCSHTPKEEDCDDGNPCTDDNCDADEGCVSTPVEDGTACDDGNSCGDAGSCQAGLCESENKCDDGDPCTIDECDDEGNCVSSEVNCDDGNPCTTDSCNEQGDCEVVPAEGLECDDGDACTSNDVCQGDGSCIGQISTCGDGALDEACNEQCDDGNQISGDGCSETCIIEETGCTGDESCDDGNSCTVDTCNDEGVCVNAPATGDTCDDGDPCTLSDACGESGTCEGVQAVCGDGTLNGSCEEECDDGNTVSGDGCSETCTLEPIACVDNSDCDDGNLCTDNTCENNSCSVTFNTAPCDDGENCSTGDACDMGACMGGTFATCDDGNICTIDSCAADGSCLFAPQTGTPCDDGDGCTTGDVCGVSAGGSPTCSGTQEPGCVETFTLCTLEGTAGNTVDCAVRLAKEDEGNPDVVALQFDIFYEPGELTLENAFGKLCPDITQPDLCFDQPLMPGGALGTGHNLSSQPGEPAECNGDVTYILSKLSFPFVGVTDAFFDESGTIQGFPEIFILRFTLAQDADADTPAGVNIGNIVASSADAESIDIDVKNEVMVSGETAP